MSTPRHHNSNSRQHKALYCLFSVAIIFFTLFIFSPAAGGTSPAKPKVIAPVITAKVSPKARLTIYKTVAMLPVLVDGKTIDGTFSQVLYQALLNLKKYHLLPLESAESWLAKKMPATKPLSLVELGHQAGIDLRASAVITAETQTHYKIGELLTGIQGAPVTTCTLTMWDTRNQKPVWNLSISRQDNGTLTSGPDLTATTIHQAMNILRAEMVKRGDIFSTQLPQPEVLSTQGDIRSVRIVLQPDPPHIFSAYQLLHADSADSSFTPAGPPVANKAPLILVDKGLRDATGYFYTVIGFSSKGFANVPAPPFKITTTGAPAPVNSLHAAGGSLRHIQLFWEPSQDPTVKEYVIFRSHVFDGPFEKIAIVSGRDQQTYIDKGQPSGYSRYGVLQDNRNYFYTIRTRNIVGVESCDTQIVSAMTKGAPQPPTNLQAIDRQPKKIPLAWSAAPDPEVVGYAIYRASKPEGPFTQIDYVNGRENQQYVDDGSWDHPLKNDTTYWYRLHAVNVVEVQSPDSSTVSATTKPAPQAVTGVQATSGLFRQIKLSWQPNPEPDIQVYEIYRGMIVSDINTKVTSVKPQKTSYTDRSLEDDRTYWYQIRAVDRDGLSGKRSAVIQATTKQPPVRPTGLKAEINDKGIMLSWKINPEQDIDHYEVSSGGFLTGLLGQPKEPYFLYQQEEKPGTALRFQVLAVDSDGLESEYSEPIEVIVPK
jgi:fibronectin type 3 domain-containing protein